MLKHTPAVVLVLLLGLLGGCSGADTHESLGVASIDALEDFAEVLADVKDVASAQAAAPRLEKISERMSDLNERRKAMGEPDPADLAAFDEKFSERMTAVGEKLFAELERISELDPAVNAELDRIMERLQDDMTMSN